MILNEVTASQQIGFPILSILIVFPIVWAIILNLIENDEPVFRDLEEVIWIGQANTIIRILEIEVDGVALLSNAQGERGLPDLAWPDKDNRSLEIERIFDLMEHESFNHHCNIGFGCAIFNDKLEHQ